MPRQVVCDSAFEQVLARHGVLSCLDDLDLLPPATLGELGIVLVIVLVIVLLGCLG